MFDSSAAPGDGGPHLALLDHLILEEEVQHAGEFAHREPVIGWKVTHVAAVVNYGKSAGFRSHLAGGEEIRGVSRSASVQHKKSARRLSETLATSSWPPPRGDPYELSPETPAGGGGGRCCERVRQRELPPLPPGKCLRNAGCLSH